MISSRPLIGPPPSPLHPNKKVYPLLQPIFFFTPTPKTFFFDRLKQKFVWPPKNPSRFLSHQRGATHTCAPDPLLCKPSGRQQRCGVPRTPVHLSPTNANVNGRQQRGGFPRTLVCLKPYHLLNANGAAACLAHLRTCAYLCNTHGPPAARRRAPHTCAPELYSI